jgi:hypothetical protein
MTSPHEAPSPQPLSVRYDQEAAGAASAGSRRILAITGLVMSLLLIAIALLVLEGGIVAVVILVAVLNVFMTSVYLPRVMRRSGEIHTEDGLVMMLAPDGFHRPTPGGTEHHRWDEVELSVLSESGTVHALRVALPGESYTLRAASLDPRPEQIVERAHELRRLS